ncbi:hypothetical protein [Saccharothrix syringae]|uniref:hypothetical protein n=1 Tax=Saccharothrix syringae TaxID=103733 RepID=UPI001293CC25|nr:hypothetical protein [Saccharothrix syringae]
MHLAVFDGNSWSLVDGWSTLACGAAPVPVALRAYGDRLHCIVVHPDQTKLVKRELRKDGTWDPTIQEIAMPAGTNEIGGVALTGPDLYAVAKVGQVEDLFGTPADAVQPPSWQKVELNPVERKDCRGLISAACAGLPKSVKESTNMSALRSRATMTAFRGKVWCAYDTSLASNPLYWQTYAAEAWSPPYQFGNAVCGLDPALCVYGDALYCFHRGEDEARLRWSATDGLSWSTAHDTPMKSTATPAVRAFRGKLYCAYPVPIPVMADDDPRRSDTG